MCHRLHNKFDLQVNTVQLAKEHVERSCSDNIDAAERHAELREVELNRLIVGLQAKHGTLRYEASAFYVTHYVNTTLNFNVAVVLAVGKLSPHPYNYFTLPCRGIRP